MNYQNPYYQNQNIISPYQQNQNYIPQTNYIDRTNQYLNNFQTQQQNIGLNGKYVNDFSQITANDVPMNAPAFFIKDDLSEIQVRSWNGNGLIDIKSYKAILEDKGNDTKISTSDAKSDEFTHFNEVLDGIKANVDSILASMESISKPKTSSRAKKEVDTE